MVLCGINNVNGLSNSLTVYEIVDSAAVNGLL